MKGNNILDYALLALVALCVSCQDVFKKQFNKKKLKGTYLFTAMLAFFAMLFFLGVNLIPSNSDWYYRPMLLVPSAGFALAYASATVFSVLAIKNGSLAKTSLIVSCSLLVASAYGIIFLGESITPTLVMGTVLLLVSLVLVNYEKKDSSQPVTLRWIIYVSLAFVGNGMCTVVQKIKQETFDNAGNNMFMIVGLAMVAVIMLCLALTSAEERNQMGRVIKYGWLWALLCGVANGLTNFLVIFLNNRLSASVMFPVISGGGMVLIFLYSVIFARERFKPRQIVGFFLGIASIVILNL